MGRFIDGRWVTDKEWADNDGRFKRQPVTFRDAIGDDRFPAESGRYHLYVSWACPWAHRARIVRRLKGLEDVISQSGVEALMLEDGWTHSDDWPDPLYGHEHLREIYKKANPDFTGRVTVPVLWDKTTETIVNNESSEIIRFFNSAFDDLAENPELDLYPEPLRDEIDRINDRVYTTLNNGVYKSGFASSQSAYEEAVEPLFETLNWLESQLSDGRRWLLGDTLTEADIRLFVTLVRFDAVYYSHFKCNKRRLTDYEGLWRHTREVHALPGVAESTDIEHIKAHYFGSHRSVNPTGIVPVGPELDFSLPLRQAAK